MITSAKTSFPNKVPIPGRGGSDLNRSFGGTQVNPHKKGHGGRRPHLFGKQQDFCCSATRAPPSLSGEPPAALSGFLSGHWGGGEVRGGTALPAPCDQGPSTSRDLWAASAPSSVRGAERPPDRAAHRCPFSASSHLTWGPLGVGHLHRRNTSVRGTFRPRGALWQN